MTMLIQPARLTPVQTDASEQPHRYWRMLLVSNTNNVPVMTRLEFRETNGGADVASGVGTLISGGSAGWTNPANVFDGVDSTFGYMNDSAYRVVSPGWIGRDYGATQANWKTIRQIAVRNRQDSDLTQAVTSFAIQYSDDNVTWATAWQESFNDWTALATTRLSSKSANARDRTVLDMNGSLTDTGPYNASFVANGNAAISGGRFVFDGTGDYFLASAPDGNISRLAYQATLEIDNFITNISNGSYDGIFASGTSSTQRLLVCINNLDLVILDGNTMRLTASNFFVQGVAKSFKVQFDGNAIRIYSGGALVTSGTHGTNMMFIGPGVYLGVEPSDLTNRSLNGSFSGIRIKHGLT